jgi:transposase
MEQNPDMFLDEIQEELKMQHGVIVGLSTIWDMLTELGLSRKWVSWYMCVELSC